MAHDVLADAPADFRLSARAVRVLAVAPSSLLLVVAGTLLVRRLSGALVVPLEPAALLTTGLVLSIVAWSIRAVGSRRNAAGDPLESDESAKQSERLLWFIRVGPSVAVIAVGTALSLPGTQTLPLVLFWVLIVVSQLDSIIPFRWRATVGDLSTDRSQTGGLKSEPRVLDQLTAPTVVNEDASTTEGVDELITQHLTRVRDATYGDMLYGILRADLEPNQRSSSLHVAFCPPFAKVPLMDVEQSAGPEARLKIGQLLAYGARIDLRLHEATDQPQSVVVELSVREESP